MSTTDEPTNVQETDTGLILVLSCMDPRIIPSPAQVVGLRDENTLIVRNAGGRAAEALRSIIFAQQRHSTTDIRVLHHTGCGMMEANASDGKMREDLIKNPPKPDIPSHSIVQSMSFLGFDDLKQNVLGDVEFLKQHPLILKNSEISGWIYNMETGGQATRVV